MAQELAPSFCCLGMIDECMFRCQMCFKWQEDRVVKERTAIPVEAWKRALRSLKTIVPDPHSFVVNFGGGEVLLHPDVLDVVSAAHEYGFITNIASNGWLIDDAMARRIIQSGLSSINLSLDSLQPHVHDELRGTPGATARVMEAITHLRAHSRTLEIGICTVIYERTIRDLMSLVRWVQKNPDITWVVLMAAMQPNNTEVSPEWYRDAYSYLWPKDTKAVKRFLTYMMWLKWWGWKIQNPYHQLNAFKKYFAHPETFVKHGPCNMDRAVHVSATGDIFLCFRHGKVGNIIQDDLATVWHSEHAQAARIGINQCKDNCHFLLNCFFEKEYPFGSMKR